MDEDSPTWQRLESQIEWYDRSARSSHIWFKTLKVTQIAVAAAIPASAAAGADVAVAGVLGAVVVVLEGVQTLFQFQQNWTNHRATCEALKREKALYRAGAGVYALPDRDARLAMTVETLVSEETTQWRAAQQEIARGGEPQ